MQRRDAGTWRAVHDHLAPRSPGRWRATSRCRWGLATPRRRARGPTGRAGRCRWTSDRGGSASWSPREVPARVPAVRGPLRPVRHSPARARGGRPCGLHPRLPVSGALPGPHLPSPDRERRRGGRAHRRSAVTVAASPTGPSSSTRPQVHGSSSLGRGPRPVRQRQRHPDRVRGRRAHEVQPTGALPGAQPLLRPRVIRPDVSPLSTPAWSARGARSGWCRTCPSGSPRTRR